MRALLGSPLLACRPEHATDDDVKNALVQGQGYAQAIVDALLRISGWGRWVDCQAGGGEAAVDEVGSELDSA